MINNPFTKTQLLQTLTRVNCEVADYFAAITSDKFFIPLAEAWSPAANVVHLIKSVSPVAKAMQRPKFFLRLLFGISKKSSRRFGQIKESYQRVLAGGGKATGPYIPTVEETPFDLASAQQNLLRQWHEVGNRLVAVLQAWNENDLDKYRLPHPLLGKLTIREMIFFTLYHNLHHVNNVRKRLGQTVVDV